MAQGQNLAALVEPEGKRERAKAANREAILKAAKRVFAELGYEAATVRDIIRRTELASGTFYNYFRSKEEVAEALADEGATRFRPLLREARDLSTTFEDYVRGAIRAYFQFLKAEHEGGYVIAEDGLHVHARTPELRAVYEEVRLSLEDAIARGMAPKVDADYLTSSCIGMAQELGHAMLQRDPIDVDGAATFAAEFILGGIAAFGQVR